jgi:hypothetical protein
MVADEDGSWLERRSGETAAEVAAQLLPFVAT